MLYKMTAFLKLLKSGLSSSWSFHEIGDASLLQLLYIRPNLYAVCHSSLDQACPSLPRA